MHEKLRTQTVAGSLSSPHRHSIRHKPIKPIVNDQPHVGVKLLKIGLRHANDDNRPIDDSLRVVRQTILHAKRRRRRCHNSRRSSTGPDIAGKMSQVGKNRPR